MKATLKAAVLVMAVFVCTQAFAQGIRYDNFAWTTTPVGANGTTAITPLSGAAIQWCGSPATVVNGICTNKATTYTDATLVTACNTATQVVLQGTSSCTAGSDTQGNFGVWVPIGTYTYTVSASGIGIAGPFTVTVPASNHGVRYADQFPAANVTLQIAAAATDLAGASGMVIIPSTMGAGALPTLPAGVCALDLRNSTSNGPQNTVCNLLSANQSQAFRVNIQNSPDGINGTAIIGDVTAAGSGINIIGVEGIASSTGSPGVYGVNKASGPGVQGDVFPGVNGGIGILGTTATTGGTLGVPQIAVKGVSTGNGTYGATIAGLFSNDNGFAGSFSNTAAAGSANDPVVVKVSSGINSATDLSIVNTTAGSKRWDMRVSGSVDPLTASPGMFSLYDQTDNILPFLINVNSGNLTLQLDSTGITVAGGGRTKSATFATTANCASAGGTCAAAAAGAVTIAAGAATVTVATTAVTANSQIIISRDNSLGTRLGVTCNAQSSLTLGAPYVDTRSAGVNFVIRIDVAPTTNPLCINYSIIN